MGPLAEIEMQPHAQSRRAAGVHGGFGRGGPAQPIKLALVTIPRSKRLDDPVVDA